MDHPWEEQTLHRRMTALNRAQSLVGMGSWEWDVSSGEIEFTDAMYELAGIQPHDRPLRYRDFLQLVHPHDRHRVNLTLRSALKGAPWRLEYRILRPDGQVRFVRCDGEVTFDDQGRPVQMVGTAMDITRRRHGVERLESRPELFRLLVENAQDVIFRFRVLPDWGFDYLSPSAGHFTGLTPEEIYADPNVLFERVHPEDLHRVYDAITDPEHNSPYQIRVRSKDGRWLWAEQVLVPIRDRKGALVAIEGISRDVTARKEAESEREGLLRKIEEERRWLETVVAQLPVAVVLIRRTDGTSRYFENKAAKAWLAPGKSSLAELVGIPGLVHDREGRDLTVDQLPASLALRGECVRPTEYRMRRPDGSEAEILGSAAPIRDLENHVIGAVAVWEDLTTVKQLERLREEWTSLVAHDLRQPITVIRAYAELLVRDLADSNQRKRTEHIADAAGRLDRMISDLLDASRIESRRLELEPKPVNVADWLQGVLEDARSQLPGTQIDLRIEGEPGAAFMDPDRIEQVLSNLISNAAKYRTPDTPIDVHAIYRPDDFTVSVTNQGTPIARSDLPRLFTRFHRAPLPVGRKISGLGLGLYIAKGLIDAHGGTIRGDSDPAGFNTFTITLPRKAI